MKAKLWGVRGSLPASLQPREIEQRIKKCLEGFFDAGNNHKDKIDDYLSTLPIESFGGYGSETPSCEVFTDNTSILIDGGSGIRRKGYELMQGNCGEGKGDVHILMTHFHWDHLMGFPFFSPIFIPGNTIHIYSVQPNAKESIRTLFSKPNFPVPFEMLQAKIIFHKLEPRVPKTIGKITFTPYQLDHTDPCWGYKFTCKDRNLAYCVDTECTRFSHEDLGPDLPLYQNIHTMIFDAQYTLREAIWKNHWGHSAATIGIDLAIQENIKKIIFMHHDPAAKDEDIANAHMQAQKYLAYELNQVRKSGKNVTNIEFTFAQEGMVLEI